MGNLDQRKFSLQPNTKKMVNECMKIKFKKKNLHPP